MSRISHSLSTRLAVMIIASMAGIGVSVAGNNDRPGLVVGIMVDGLQADQLNNLRHKFTNGGFNRLMRDGVYIVNADYGTSLDPTAAAALLYTGAAPSINGIGSGIVYDIEARRETPILHDPSWIGNSTSETYSPTALAVSTLADEVRIAGGGVTNVYAISPEPQLALVLGGHAANAAMWINDNTGAWATTTYYKDVPPFIAGRNRLNPLSARLDTMSWTPILPMADYPDLPEHLKHYAFRYVYPRSGSDRYTLFKNTAPVNTEVTNLASEFIQNLNLGKHDGTDMLSLTYTLAPFDFSRNPDNRLELIDSYIRLDRNLEQLFASVDRATGGNAVIFLAATPPRNSSRRDDEQWNIPYGEFSARKAGSLLNMYLMALYGTGEWVSGFHNDSFYLNTKLIKEHNLDIKDVRDQAASFVARMSGVKDVYTIDRILSGDAGDHADALKRNTVVNTSGDIVIFVNPGWEIVNDFVDIPAKRKTDATQQVVKYVPTTAPVFIMAPEVSARRIDTPVDARQITPSVARLLRIRSPNAADSPALILD